MEQTLLFNETEQRRRLEAKQTELEAILRARSGIEIEQTADPLDEVAGKAERDLLVARLDSVGVQYRDVLAALERMGAGTYGECVECEEPISGKRLAAVPWARRCIHCQEKAERMAAPERRAKDLEVLPEASDDAPVRFVEAA